MRRAGRRRVPSGAPAIGRVALSLALPLAAAAWLMLDPVQRGRVAEALPSGAGGRVVRAAAALGLLAALAWLVLPVSYHAERWLRRALAWHRRRRGAARVLLAPAEFLCGLLRGLLLALFAGTAAATVGAFVLALGFVLWIPWPGLLGGGDGIWAAAGALFP